MSLILTLLSSHLLSLLENELIQAEPAAVDLITKEVQLLIQKLENFIATKSPSVAVVANPVLTSVANITSDAVKAAGEAVILGTNVS